MKTLKQIVLDFDKCDVQVLFAAMTSEEREGGREGGIERLRNEGQREGGKERGNE